MSVVIVPTGGGTVSGIIQIGKPVNDLPNYGEGKDIIAMYGGSPCAMDPMGCLCGLFCYPCAVGQVAGLAGTNVGLGPGRSAAVRSSVNKNWVCCTIIGCILPCGWNGRSCGGQGRINLNLYLASKHGGTGKKGQCGNFCWHCWCPCIAVAQEMRAVKKYNELNPGSSGSPSISDMVR